MASALSVFLFQCRSTGAHALTLYRSGDNLPAQAGQEGWTYRAKLLMTPESLTTLALDADAVMAELISHGFLITHLGAGIITLPETSR
jgi:hypothetical protein